MSGTDALANGNAPPHDPALLRGMTQRSKRLLTEVATSSLVWPSAAVYDRLHDYVDVSGKLEVEYKSIFQPVVAG
jgi:hypothetical protein